MVAGWLFLGMAILVAMLSVSLFLPGIDGGFLFDDKPNIVENPAIQIQKIDDVNQLLHAAYSYGAGSGARALAMLSFVLDYWRAGLDPVSFKITNLIIHGITGVVLAFFFLKLLMLGGLHRRKAEWSAVILMVCWAIHPLQVSSVLYVVQRMQTLATLFVVLSLLAYLSMRARQISGGPGRTCGMLTLLFGVLAFACKEDAVLLPVYFLVIEMTVLHFGVKDPSKSRCLKQLYGAMLLVGAVVYLFFVVPHYWSWDASPGRNYSSAERLLTQGRVLLMYLVQIVIPSPDLMTFNYDSLVVSRGVFKPWTTLPSWMIVLGLLYLAWRWRTSKPLFSCGVLLFFAGHFITSNVVNLELAFEHRNHFPLVGAVLAVGALLADISTHLQVKTSVRKLGVLFVCLVLGFATLQRSYAWGDALRLAEHNLRINANSERAWLFLCGTEFERAKLRGGGVEIGRAVDVCEAGATAIPGSMLLMHNVLVFRGMMGRESDQDWNRFLDRLRKVKMKNQDQGALWVTLLGAERGHLNNERHILETIDIATAKMKLTSTQYLRVGAFIFNETEQPVRAFRYLRHAVEAAPPSDPEVIIMLSQLKAAGLDDWVLRLQEVK